MFARRGCLAFAAVAICNLAAAPAFAQSSATFGYDALGRLIRVTYPSGAYIMYEYDKADNRVLLAMSLTANNLPIANPDGPIAVPVGGTVNIDVLLNDTDADNHPRRVYKVIAGPKGTPTIIPSGALVSYTATAGQTGADSFTYAIRDSRGGVSAPATVSVMIGTNSAPLGPTAVDDSVTTGRNVAKQFDPKTNDLVQNGYTLSLISVTQPSHGATTHSGGLVTYTPTTGYVGLDTFDYTISDGHGGTDVGTVQVDVINTPPVANPDNYSGYRRTAIQTKPLSNDTDANNDALSIVSYTQPPAGQGQVTPIDATTLSYLTNDFVGTTFFDYVVTDGIEQRTARVTIQTTNRPPVAFGGSFTAQRNTSLPISPSFSDPDTDSVSIYSVDSPTQNGGSTSRSGNVITYNAPNTLGEDRFVYRVVDALGATSNATIFVTVTAPPPPPNVPPNAEPDSYNVLAGQQITVNPAQNDIDTDPLQIVGHTTPTGGSITSWGPSFIAYQAPATGGDYSFEYTVSDGKPGGTASEIVVMHVAAPATNHAPVAYQDEQLLLESSPTYGNTFVPVLNNDVDVDGDPITIVQFSSPGTGAAVQISGGGLMVTNISFGMHIFTYQITDGRQGYAWGTVIIERRDPNAPPEG